MKRLLSCTSSEMLKMDGQELKQAILASEGRTVMTETVVAIEPLLGDLTNAELAVSFGSDMVLLNCFDCNNPEIKGLPECDNPVEKLKEIIGEIEINDIYTEIKILLPRMVLNELYQQQLEMFDDLNKRLENVSMPNMQYDRAFNYGEYLETIFKKAIMELKQGIVAVEVVDFPASDRLNSIISRAIKKEPPFEGKEKHSDKGFKDVLIWESIKEYKEKHINDIIVFYCNDNLLASNALRKEFKEDFRDEIYIEQKNALMKRLTTLCNKNETEKTFSSQLNERIENCLSHNNEILYDLLMEDSVWNDGDTISDFEVKKVNILNCNDIKIHNRILYKVEIEIKMYYAKCKDRDMYKIIGERQLDIYYDFNDDVLLTNHYETLTMGDCNVSDFIVLE